MHAARPEVAHERSAKAVNKWVKKKVTQAVHVVKTAYHATVQAAKATGTFLKNHAAAIAVFAVSTLAFAGCEAVLGAATGGVGGKAFKAIGGLFGRGGGDVAEGGAESVTSGAAENAASDGAEGAASDGAGTFRVYPHR